VTLVLSLGTSDCLYQITDRRLTLPDGAVTTDDENKATIWFGKMVFGYSGLAVIDKQPTDLWFAFTAGDAPERHKLQSVLDHVRDAATAKLAQLRIDKRFKRLAIVGIGWLRLSEGAPLTPVECTITNAQTEDGRWLSGAQPTFINVCRPFAYSDRGFGIFGTGVEADKQPGKETWRTIDRCLKHKSTPEAVVYALVRCMHRLADHYPTIGKSLMAMTLPRAVVERGEQGIRGALPSLDAASFVYIPLTKSTHKFVWYGPNVVGPHGTIGGVKITGVRGPPPT
jgi:hypothetical protein